MKVDVAEGADAVLPTAVEGKAARLEASVVNGAALSTGSDLMTGWFAGSSCVGVAISVVSGILQSVSDEKTAKKSTRWSQILYRLTRGPGQEQSSESA